MPHHITGESSSLTRLMKNVATPSTSTSSSTSPSMACTSSVVSAPPAQYAYSSCRWRKEWLSDRREGGVYVYCAWHDHLRKKLYLHTAPLKNYGDHHEIFMKLLLSA